MYVFKGGFFMRKLMRFSIALLISFSPTLFLAQSTNSGDIRGTVTDASGAVMPGVTVTAEDVDKNVTRTYTTNGSGLYDTGSIVPDHYILTYTKDGFNTVVRGPITLQVGISGVNATLSVGATTQRVPCQHRSSIAEHRNRLAVDHTDFPNDGFIAAGRPGLGKLHHFDAGHLRQPQQCGESG